MVKIIHVAKETKVECNKCYSYISYAPGDIYFQLKNKFIVCPVCKQNLYLESFEYIIYKCTSNVFVKSMKLIVSSLAICYIVGRIWDICDISYIIKANNIVYS
jgi:uncharacterized protein YbaR (Trm112 family)